ncbi:MAG: pyrimidine dimer DNA glycosylase/endonuclease V [Candidatus Bathyarchaeia archaeon]
MRLWSIHPKYLDAKGLVALWREALLAKAVLEGRSEGYRNHPQIERFKEASDPKAAINLYLYHVWMEARRRGYNFDGSKIDLKCVSRETKIPVKKGQVRFELNHLGRKLKARCPAYITDCGEAETHPLFYVVGGGVEPWEKRGEGGNYPINRKFVQVIISSSHQATPPTSWRWATPSRTKQPPD